MVYPFNRAPIPTANDRWTSGFVDREGCFSISFLSNSNAFRIRLLVSQKGEENLPVLRGLTRVFSGIGRIEKHSKADNWTFVISGNKNCYSVYPYFSMFALKTKKASAFAKWKVIHKHISLKNHSIPFFRIEMKEAAAQINLGINKHAVKKRAIFALEETNTLLNLNYFIFFYFILCNYFYLLCFIVLK